MALASQERPFLRGPTPGAPPFVQPVGGPSVAPFVRPRRIGISRISGVIGILLLSHSAPMMHEGEEEASLRYVEGVALALSMPRRENNAGHAARE